jgi:hypothetical protein
MNYLDDQDYFSNYNEEVVTMLTDHLQLSQRYIDIENVYTTRLYYTRIIQLLFDYSYKDIYFSMGVFMAQYYEDQEEAERHMDVIRSIIYDTNVINERVNERVNELIVLIVDGLRIVRIESAPQHSLQNVEFIIKKEDMDQIPIFHFSAISKTGAACSICQTDFEDSDEIPKFDCNHLFHKECIFKWFSEKGKDNNKCPNCREELIKHSII